MTISAKTRFIQTTLNQKLFEQVKLYAMRLDISLAKFIRRALIYYLEHEPVPDATAYQGQLETTPQEEV